MENPDPDDPVSTAVRDRVITHVGYQGRNKVKPLGLNPRGEQPMTTDTNTRT